MLFVSGIQRQIPDSWCCGREEGGEMVMVFYICPYSSHERWVQQIKISYIIRWGPGGGWGGGGLGKIFKKKKLRSPQGPQPINYERCLTTFNLEAVTHHLIGLFFYQHMLEIEEKGTKFAEGIEIDEQRNVAVFRVPAHNDVLGADFYNDFQMVSV